MRQIFVPYNGSKPASLEIKGHCFIILSRAERPLKKQLSTFGADHLRAVAYRDSVDEDLSLDNLARTINGAVVIAPPNIKIEELVSRIESELPWIH
jgi:hypothetical protein